MVKSLRNCNSGVMTGFLKIVITIDVAERKLKG